MKSGLLSFIAAMFTTMVRLSAGLRNLWLVICLASLVLSLVGMALFCLSYQASPARQQMLSIYF